MQEASNAPNRCLLRDQPMLHFKVEPRCLVELAHVCAAEWLRAARRRRRGAKTSDGTSAQRAGPKNTTAPPDQRAGNSTVVQMRPPNSCSRMSESGQAPLPGIGIVSERPQMYAQRISRNTGMKMMANAFIDCERGERLTYDYTTEGFCGAQHCQEASG